MYTHAHTLTRTLARMHTLTCTHTHTHTHAQAHTHAHTRTHTLTHAHTQACGNTHTHTHKCMHTHSHAHIRTHTHARTHTHTLSALYFCSPRRLEWSCCYQDYFMIVTKIWILEEHILIVFPPKYKGKNIESLKINFRTILLFCIYYFSLITLMQNKSHSNV